MRALRQYAGNYKYNSLAGVEDEKETGAIYGTGEKANVCLFPRGSVNPWNVRARCASRACARQKAGEQHAQRRAARLLGPSDSGRGARSCTWSRT